MSELSIDLGDEGQPGRSSRPGRVWRACLECRKKKACQNFLQTMVLSLTSVFSRVNVMAMMFASPAETVIELASTRRAMTMLQRAGSE